ncbi:hypothetical protein [Bacillus sp. FJAT-29814]|uniref:hypothetical protein n=1 Tax=Bacillus sp. FJAT-29814 TaxID=1729688 RepID=UPI000ADB2B3F|nr:hypothetical protein [Bacillus sp. FJAT-29814]
MPAWLWNFWYWFWYFRKGKVAFHVVDYGDIYHAIASNGKVTVCNCYGSTRDSAIEMAAFKLKKALEEESG